MSSGEDWLDINRRVLPDVHPNRRATQLPGGVVRNYGGGTEFGPSMTETVVEEGAPGAQPFNLLEVTTPPAPRPYAYQQASNTSIPVTEIARAITQQTFPCDAILLSVPTGGNAVFLGYSNATTPTSGIQISAAQPVIISPDNTRELWELQRCLEMMLALQLGGDAVPKYRAPRVVFDASKYFLVCAAGLTQVVACMLFYVPEGQ